MDNGKYRRHSKMENQRAYDLKEKVEIVTKNKQDDGWGGTKTNYKIETTINAKIVPIDGKTGKESFFFKVICKIFKYRYFKLKWQGRLLIPYRKMIDGKFMIIDTMEE